MMGLPLIRPIRHDDLDVLERFSKEAGFGLTTLPKERALLEQAISFSLRSFSPTVNKPGNEHYLFVLEDADHNVIGTSGIVSRIGIKEPFFAYQLKSTQQTSKTLNVDRTVPLLHFIKAVKKPTEIGSLFLTKKGRGQSLGKLLSYCRFLFIASFRSRFASVVISELRGVCDPSGSSPFFEAVGRPFLNTTFDETNLLRIHHPKAIEEVFPKHPIYPWLLPESAQAVIQQTQAETAPALALLQKEGFQLANTLDIFDAGPHAYCRTEEIKSVAQTKQVKVMALAAHLPSKPVALMTNASLEFRATLAPFERSTSGGVTLTKECAQLLNVSVDDDIALFPLF